ncbi:acylphosphatase [Sutcliffiella horikoshii]|uniref:acylphosphatase n=1 Tax=Sutcliffiella horikoshii TaxID=79883 RepID=UPI00384CEF3A
MQIDHSICLPHLTSEIVRGARKTRLCAYAVALEGWRRGLTLTWYTSDSPNFDNMITFGVNPPGRLFSLSSKDRTHFFFRTRGDKVSNEAVEIGADKDETKKMLAKHGVPTPMGKKFNTHHRDEEIIQYSSSIEFPLVLKPFNGSLGNGVVTNIKNQEELSKALIYVRQELNYPEVIIERFVPGEEYRVYVIEDKVIAAYNRLAASVLGDGVHTIEELIVLKNQQKKKNPRLFSCLININKETIDFIHQFGYTLESIPVKGEKVLLQEKTNVSAGGDPVDVTDELPEVIGQIAIDAVKAIPGLHHGGVDIIIDPNKPIEKAGVVIEINPTAQIGGILYPVKGKARDIPAAIIDYYFPETVGEPRSEMYFDFKTVLEPLESRTAIEVEVPKAPKGKIFNKKYTVSGDVQSFSYQQRLKREAHNMDLHGHIKNHMNGDIEIVVAGTSYEAVSQFKNIINNTEYAVTKISEDYYDQPIQVGFHVTEQYLSTNLKSINVEVRKLEKELNNMEKEKKNIQKQNVKITSSRSWGFTAPIRKAGGLFKAGTVIK